MNRSSLEASGPFDAAVFAGGGCRCFWQAGFWNAAAEPLGLRPSIVGATSAGSSMACALFAGVFDSIYRDFLERIATNARNVYPANLMSDRPVFPHEAIYRGTVLAGLDGDALATLKAGPDVRVMLARPPAWLGARSGLAAGMLAYQLERRLSGAVHPRWGRRLGFRAEILSVRGCRDAAELADLLLQASCTPPMTPLYRRDGRVTLDGGLVDNVPVEAVAEAERTLVLLSRRYPPGAIPNVAGRVYVQPSVEPVVDKWDYTSPALVRATYEAGFRDGEAFVAGAL